MKTWKITFIEHLLNNRYGLYYYGDDAEFEAQIERHHPWINKEADRLTKLVEDKIAHDAVFKKEKPTS